MIIIDDHAAFVHLGPLWTRNLMVESIVSKDAEYAFYYSYEVLASRWHEGEKAIKANRFICNKYIEHTMKANLPEGRKLLNIA